MRDRPAALLVIMAQPNNNFILDDDPEINPNPQNLAAALVVIGRTARKYVTELDAIINTDLEIAIFSSFITRGSNISPAPTVPEHRATLENRNNNSLTYKPYRPYTPFTPPVPREGQHSSHSLHCVSQSTPTSSLNVASHQAMTTKSPSSFPAPASLLSPASPTIPMTVSPVIPTTRPDTSTFSPIIALPNISTTSAHSSSRTTAPMSIPDAQQNDKNDITMDDGPPSSQADRETMMDQDIPTAVPLPPTNHVTSPKPVSGLPVSSGRTKALPLPSITESHLGHLVNQQLSQISDQVVVPALKSAVDAMIPTLIDRIANEIKSIHSTCSHNPRAHNSRTRKRGGTSEEDDTSEPECDDDLTPSPRRKHPGKRGIKNHLHDVFRTYLREKRLLKYKSGPLPQSPPPQMVQAFNHDNENPPSLDNITIDWQDSLRSSLWNTEAVNLLVVDFQQKIQTGCYPLVIFDEDMMSLDDLRVLCIIKLRRTQQAYRDRNKIAGLADLQQREEATHELSSRSTRRQRLDRLNTRKHGTLERRRKIAEQNRQRNPQMWDTIRRIIDRLDVDGMSGDETDTPVGAKPKVVRRVALPWISPAITDLLHAVESYAPATYEENMTIPVGNTSLSRFMEARCTSKNSIAIARLPRNWYHDDWYKVNSTSARALLDVRKDFEIPRLVRRRIV
ncbi:uncharacterized protein F5147DRAFT_779002 [Suillus discolor]|uniref:Uncharacterized protein n=1 Tax=Suillus discolor TaxID=1912936 RepID=A0A9P7EW13_9AGAM|nr:uncharacterized protein F5147DRAFT_779002 [Suillus discolor]KAG2094399.1 hypothetical protein F5147DRAFT_779002 [Suillus discolor]